jgi:SAM-dependent methyltransferase
MSSLKSSPDRDMPHLAKSDPPADERLLLVCPSCLGGLNLSDSSSLCDACGRVYPLSEYGYLDLTPRLEPGTRSDLPSTPDDYAHEQHSNGERLFEEFLKPLLAKIRPRNALDVGCGAGEMVRQFRKNEIRCFGIDLPSNAKHWSQAGADVRSVFGADARRLPFAANSFDFVMSLGVMEHIGTLNGHCTLSKTYTEDRSRYADEIVRVTKPNGTIVIAAPNKLFPVDIQHGPTDALSRKAPVRSFVCDKTGLNIHKTWGDYHLPSYAEVRQLFLTHAGARTWEPLPLKGYFGFGRFKHGFLRPFSYLAETYVEHFPKSLLGTFLNPYVLVKITK